MNKSCDDDWIADAHQHLACSQLTDDEDEASQQRPSSAGVHQQPQAAQRNSKNRHLKFQNTAAAVAEPSSPRRSSHTHSDRAFLLPAREMLARECARLSRAIRRAAAAACLAPSTGADEDDLPFPYTQLDKVTRAVSREAFGPLYLVT